VTLVGNVLDFHVSVVVGWLVFTSMKNGDYLSLVTFDVDYSLPVTLCACVCVCTPKSRLCARCLVAQSPSVSVYFIFSSAYSSCACVCMHTRECHLLFRLCVVRLQSWFGLCEWLTREHAAVESQLIESVVPMMRLVSK